MSRETSRLGAMLVLLLPLGVGACSPAAPAQLAVVVARPGNRVSGTCVIVAMRPPATGPAAGTEARRDILRAVGYPAPPRAGVAAMEFIIRDDAGGIFSVMQADDSGFHLGELVVLTRGQHARIVRASG